MCADKNITLVSENNIDNSIKCDMLFAFEFDGNKYIVYNKNEKDYDGNDIIYCGKIDVINNKQYIKNIEGEVYIKIKDIIRKMIDYSGEDYAV